MWNPPPPHSRGCCYVPLIPGYWLLSSEQQASRQSSTEPKRCRHHTAAKGTFKLPSFPNPFFTRCLLSQPQTRRSVTLRGLCEEEETRDVGEKKNSLRWKTLCENKDSFISCMCSVEPEWFPVEETSALTSKYILQKRQKEKARKNL